MIHAWTHLKEKWVRITVFPSAEFLAENQLASDSPDSLKLAVIPALFTILDSSLVDYRSHRVIKIYLVRFKSLKS